MRKYLDRPVKDILLVTVGYTLGGAERMIQRIAPLLQERGYKVRVLAFKGWGPISQDLKKKDIECVSLFGKGRFDIRIIWRYFIHLRRFPPDIIIAFLYRAYIPTRIFGWILGIPNVSSVRDVQEWINPIQRLLDRFTSPLSFVIYACSNGVKEFLVKTVKIPAMDIITILNGIDVKDFRINVNRSKKLQELGLNPDKLVVGTVSRLHEPKKGFRFLLKAAQNLQKRYECQFLIVGGGKDEAELKEMAKEMELKVLFTREREDVPELLQVMDIFVLSSLYEGLPVSLLEAMASGLPVVATKVGGMPEVVVDGKTGFLVDPGSYEQLIEKIGELLRNSEKRKLFGISGLERVKKAFSIEKTVNEIEGLWKESWVVGRES